MTASDDLASADLASVDAVIARARRAQKAYEAKGSQDLYARAAQAAAWAIMEPDRSRALAEHGGRRSGVL